MKRLLKLLTRLYPSSWRERYGEEYEALLEDVTPRARDLFDVFWGAGKMQMTTWSLARIVLACSLSGAFAAVAISFAQPKTYMSQTLIMMDHADRRSIDNELQRRAEDAFAEPFLADLIQRENLYPSERARMAQSDVVNLMRRDIWLRRLQKSDGGFASAFVAQFIYPDPRVAQRVDRELVSELIAANLRTAINDPTRASRSPLTLAVWDPADLPQKPHFPNRAEFGASGLIAGLLGGLIVVALAGWRRNLTVANG